MIDYEILLMLDPDLGEERQEEIVKRTRGLAGRHVRERARARRGGKRRQSSIGSMKRLLTGIGGALGLAALVRLVRGRRSAPADTGAVPEPAEELRRKLAEAREAAEDRDEFDASEGQPVDEVDEPRSIEERRRAIHERAQEALDEMRRLDDA